jgi:hypothetical protein
MGVYAMRSIIENINDIKTSFAWIEKGTTIRPWNQGRVHSSLAIKFFFLGMIYIKDNQISLAKGSFQYSIDMMYWLFEKYFSSHDFTPDAFMNLDDHENQVIIKPGMLAAISWHQLFLALLLNQSEKLVQFNSLYKQAASRNWEMYEHDSNSRYIGLLASSLISNDFSATQRILEKKQPKIIPEFRGIVDSLVALAREDQDDFLESMKKAENCWTKESKDEGENIPTTTCHIFGACLFKLAERVFCKPMHLDYISRYNTVCFPLQLLDDNLPIEYPLPIPDFVLS